LCPYEEAAGAAREDVPREAPMKPCYAGCPVKQKKVKPGKPPACFMG